MADRPPLELGRTLDRFDVIDRLVPRQPRHPCQPHLDEPPLFDNPSKGVSIHACHREDLVDAAGHPLSLVHKQIAVDGVFPRRCDAIWNEAVVSEGVRSAQRKGRLRGLITIHDVWACEASISIVMERGRRTLGDVVEASDGGLNAEVAQAYARQILVSLMDMQDVLGVDYRDLGIDNIVLVRDTSSGALRAKLIDFGACLPMEWSGASRVPSQLAYFGPELRAGQGLRHEAINLHTLGVMVLEMVHPGVRGENAVAMAPEGYASLCAADAEALRREPLLNAELEDFLLRNADRDGLTYANAAARPWFAAQV